MLTVVDVAARTGRNPETVRRWIREGKLPAKKIGQQHFVEEADLDAWYEGDVLPLPADWGVSKELMAKIVTTLRRQRAEH